ncbi:hypothetical protein AMJ44_01795 [candidate division WOR-1 bacterium DG_54_3]|uniref:Uncharacterized protein n=1 Tax=candidate division WOR-1 bacterium DG_54_3 TaxID=1703775 RepID=A0A0S7Y586_UNCSA|nr:MAG: hypothetical protein AMJ44_01795 [candidate division WOR-1 bacterium DG_54_3]
MKKEPEEEKNSKFPEKGYELISWARRGKDITFRDDQFHFPWLMDIVKSCQKRRCRFRLIDSGKLETFEVELLGKAGADIYTSDEARPSDSEIELINKACRKSGTIVADFHRGPLEEEKPEEDSGSMAFSGLERLGERGVYLHLTNKERERNFLHLGDLANACLRGGSWLVYYHHGPLEQSLGELAGAWIHISDDSLKESQEKDLLMEIIKAGSAKGANFMLHLGAEWRAYELQGVIKAGAVPLFKSALRDYRSPLKPLEKEAGRRKLDFRSYYLYPYFLP